MPPPPFVNEMFGEHLFDYSEKCKKLKDVPVPVVSSLPENLHFTLGQLP